MVKGTVSITLSDFQSLLDAATRAKETEENLRRAAKELQVFLSYIALKADIEKDEAEKIAQLIADNGGTTEIK